MIQKNKVFFQVENQKQKYSKSSFIVHQNFIETRAILMHNNDEYRSTYAMRYNQIWCNRVHW